MGEILFAEIHLTLKGAIYIYSRNGGGGVGVEGIEGTERRTKAREQPDTCQPPCTAVSYPCTYCDRPNP